MSDGAHGHVTHCHACGTEVAAERTRCHSCGAEMGPDAPSSGSWGQSTRLLGNQQIPEGAGAATLFQPSILMDGIFGETNAADAPSAKSATASDGASLERPPSLRLEVSAYFLMVGAPPGFERIELTSAQTVVGREGTDLVLDDAKISSRHCQIDVMGREFYVRDLDSLNGTYLNGHKIRSSQILPGDSLRVGKTTLVFCVGNPSGEQGGSSEG